MIVSLISEDEEEPSPTARRKDEASEAPATRATSHERLDLSRACSCAVDKLERHKRRLLSSSDTISTAALQDAGLERQFHDGVDNVLHCITRDPTFPRGLCARIVDHLRLANNIDARDCDGMTALEIVIRMADHETIKILLCAGASPRFCSVSNQTILKVSMLHFPSYDVAVEILSAATGEGSVNAMKWYWTARAEALELASDTLRSETQSWRPIDIYRLVLLILKFDSGLQEENRIPVATRDFTFRVLVETWDRNMQHPSVSAADRTPVMCCEELLKSGANMLLPSDQCSSRLSSQPPNAPLESRSCNTLADLAMFHQADSRLASAIITNHSKEYAAELARCMLNPCPFRIATIDGDQLAAWLHCLLVDSSPNKLDLLLFALRLSPTSLKYLFVRTVLSPAAGVLFDSSRETDAWDVLEGLCCLEESLRWPVAELILKEHLESRFAARFVPTPSPRGLFVDSVPSAINYLDHVYRTTQERCDGKAVHTPPPPAFVPNYRSSQGGFRWPHVGSVLPRCVVHVISKTMLDERGQLGRELPAKTRTLRALRLRHDAGLPDISIDNSLLIGILS